MKVKHRIKLISLLSIFALFACKKELSPNLDPKAEVGQGQNAEIDHSDQEWLILFDGTDFDEWRGYRSSEISDSWEIQDGSMHFIPGKPGSHNIISRKKFENFILTLEWKVSKGGNSGIFWGVFESDDYSQPYLTGPEIQILDNDNNEEGTAANGTHAAGSLFDMIACDPALIKPYNQWNTCILQVDHRSNMASVEMNGNKAFNFSLSGEEWENLVAGSKFKDWNGFGKYTLGHIGLQDHGDEVWFRNIKIKEIK